MTEPAALDGPHWHFAVDLYAQDGVSQACLALQERFGVDVIVLMICLFGATTLGKAPNTEDIAHMDAEISKWRQSVVHPLREIRRYLKTAGMSEATERLRDIIKSSELRSEQIELAALVPQADKFSRAAPQNLQQLHELVYMIVHFYAQRTKGAPTEPETIQLIDDATLAPLQRAWLNLRDLA